MHGSFGALMALIGGTAVVLAVVLLVVGIACSFSDNEDISGLYECNCPMVSSSPRRCWNTHIGGGSGIAQVWGQGQVRERLGSRAEHIEPQSLLLTTQAEVDVYPSRSGINLW
jgi:hypothetical protein